MNIDTTSIDTAFLPDVFFTKILLETSSTPQNKEPKNIGRANTGAPVSWKPTSVNTGGALKVTLSLTIMDHIDESGITSWFYNEDLTKYLKIKIIQSNHSKITRSLMKGNFAILDNNKNFNLFDQKEIKVKKDENQSITDFISFDTQQNKRIFSIDYTLSFIINDVEPEHLSYFAICYFDLGALTKDYEMEFLLPNSNANLVRGSIVGEKVIEKSSLQLETYAFFLDRTGEVWPGLTHRMEDGRWMTMERHGVESKYLVRRQMANTKIQDFREIDAIKLMDFDLTPAANVFSSIEKRGATQHVIQNPPEVYFSDAFLSYGVSGQSKFLFQLDYNRIIRDKTQFGNIIDKASNPQAFAEIYEASKITLLKVLRRRIKFGVGDNRLGSPVFGQIIVDPSEPVALITMTADTPGSEILKSTNDNWGGIRELSLLGGNSQLRTFTVTDKGATRITDGYYQYGVEIEIKDGTVDFLNKQLKRLIEIQDIMNLYSSTASMPQFYNHKSHRFTKKLKKYYRGFKPSNMPWVKSIAIFMDVITSLAPMGDPKSMGKRLFAFTSPNSGSLEGIRAFITVIEMLITKLTNILGPQIHTQMPGNEVKRMTSSKFKSSVITLRRYFNEIWNSNERSDVGIDYLAASGVRNLIGLKGVTTKSFKERIEKENSLYWTTPDLDSIGQTLSGVELGGMSGINEDILQLADIAPSYVTPGVIYAGNNLVVNRVDTAEGAYNTEQFTAVTAVIVAASTGQYTCGGGQDTVATNGEVPPVGHQALDNVMSQLNVQLIPSPETKFMQISIGQHRPQKLSVGEILGEFDLLVRQDIGDTAPPSCEEEIIITQLEVKNRKQLPLATTFMRNLATTGALKQRPGQKRVPRSPFTRPQFNNKHSFDLNNSENLLAKMRKTKNAKRSMTMTRPGEEPPLPKTSAASKNNINFDLVPNQIRSLMLGQSDGVVNKWSDTDIDLIKDVDTSEYYRYNYDMISQVEVFTGYTTNSKGVSLMMSPKWTLLKSKHLNNIKRKNVLLCRIRKYTNQILGVGTSDGIDIKSFDEYFLISNAAGNFRLKRTKKPVDQSNLSLGLSRMGVGHAVLGVLEAENNSSLAVSPTFQSNMAIVQQPKTKLDII